MVKGKKPTDHDKRMAGRKRGGEDDSYSLDDGGGASESGEEAAATAPDLSMDSLRKVFHLPCVDAAAALGVAHSKLKRRCHKLKISRWPQRKLASLVFLRDALPNDPRLSDVQREAIINKIDEEYTKVMQEPNHPLDKELEQLRKSNYKLNYNRKLKCAAKAMKRGGSGGDADTGVDISAGGIGAGFRSASAATNAADDTGHWGGLQPRSAAAGRGLRGLPPLQTAPRGGRHSPTGSEQDHVSGGGVGGGGADSPAYDGSVPDDLVTAVGVSSPRKNVRRPYPHLGVGGGGTNSPGGGGHSAPGRRSSLERAALLSVIADGKIVKQGSRRQSGSGSGNATPRQLPGGGSAAGHGLGPGMGLGIAASGSIGGGGGAGLGLPPSSPQGRPGSASGPQSPRLQGARNVGSPAMGGASRESLLDAIWAAQQHQQQQQQLWAQQLQLQLQQGGAGAGGGAGLGFAEDEQWAGSHGVRPSSPILPRAGQQSRQPQPPYPTHHPLAGDVGAAGYGAGGAAVAAAELYGNSGSNGVDSALMAAGVNAILADTSAGGLLAGLEGGGGGGGARRQSLGAEQLSEEELALLGIQGADRDLLLDPSTDSSLDPLLHLLLSDTLTGSAPGRPTGSLATAAHGPATSLHPSQSLNQHHFLDAELLRLQKQNLNQSQGMMAASAVQHGGGLQSHQSYPGPAAAHPLGRRMSDAMPLGDGGGGGFGILGGAGGGGFGDGGVGVRPAGVASLLRSSTSGLIPGSGSASAGSFGGLSALHRQHRLSSVSGAGPSSQRVSRFAGGLDLPLASSQQQQMQLELGGLGPGDGFGGGGGMVGAAAPYDDGYSGGGRGGGAVHPGRLSLNEPALQPGMYGDRYGIDGAGGGGGCDPLGQAAFAGRRFPAPSGLHPAHPHHRVISAFEGRHSAPGQIEIPGWDDAQAAAGGVGLTDAAGVGVGVDRRPDFDNLSAAIAAAPRRMLQSSAGILQPVPKFNLLGPGSRAGPGLRPLGGGLGAGVGGIDDLRNSAEHQRAPSSLPYGKGAGPSVPYVDACLAGGRAALASYGEVDGPSRRLDQNLGGSWGGGRRPDSLMLTDGLMATATGHGMGPVRSSSLSGLLDQSRDLGGGGGGFGAGLGLHTRGGGSGGAGAGLLGRPATAGASSGLSAGLPSLPYPPYSRQEEQQLAREQLARAMQRSSSNNGGAFSGVGLGGGGGFGGVPGAGGGGTLGLQRPGLSPDLGGIALGQQQGVLSSGSISGAHESVHRSPPTDAIASLQGLRLRGEDDRPGSQLPPPPPQHPQAPHQGYQRHPGGAADAGGIDEELSSVLQDLQELRRQHQQQQLRQAAGAPGPGQTGPLDGGGGGGARCGDLYGSHATALQLQQQLHQQYVEGRVDAMDARPVHGGVGVGIGVGVGGQRVSDRVGSGAAAGGLLEALDCQLSDIDSFVERNMDLLQRNGSGFGSFVVETRAAGGVAAAGAGGGGMDVESMRENLRRELRQGSAEQWEEMLRQLGGGGGGGGGGGVAGGGGAL